jgi:peptidoglycan/LPS O-acetylase OafA/YrhL
MRGAFKSGGAIVVGFLVAAILVMLITFVAGYLLVPGFPGDPMAEPTGPYLVANLVGSFLAAVVGGYTTGRIAGRAPLVHAGVLALLMVAMTVASGAEAAPGQPAWYPLTIAILGAVGALCGGALRLRSGRRG